MKNYMIEIAKDAILEELTKKSLINREKLLKEHPLLAKKGATFVTLQKRSDLRGCIGSLVAHRCILDDLVSNAKMAAFNDPRFPPVTLEEFKNLNIEISLLSEPKELLYKDIEDLKSKIVVGRDGVVLKKGSHQATFLPQVWEQLPTFELFFAHLCQKATLDANCLEDKPAIFIYHVQKVKQ